jgi:hypothetical protein
MIAVSPLEILRIVHLPHKYISLHLSLHNSLNMSAASGDLAPS